MEKKQTLSRSVSIIGVGMTKYGDPAENPELEGMSLQDMAAWACADAMEDAGVNPRDIGKLVMGMVCSPVYNSETLSPNHGFLEYIGMKGKAAVYHNEVCATSMNCLNEAIEAVASGRCDVAMCVDSDSVRYEHRLCEISGNTLIAEDISTGERVTFPADQVILCMGGRPSRGIYEELSVKREHVFLVGDAEEQAKIRKAVQDGYTVAMAL